MVKRRRMTCYSDAEERAAGMDAAVPFLVESKLRERGADMVPGGRGGGSCSLAGAAGVGRSARVRALVPGRVQAVLVPGSAQTWPQAGEPWAAWQA